MYTAVYSSQFYKCKFAIASCTKCNKFWRCTEASPCSAYITVQNKVYLHNKTASTAVWERSFAVARLQDTVYTADFAKLGTVLINLYFQSASKL